MSEESSNRKRFYGEVKTWPRTTIQLHPDVLKILNRYRGPKSWSRFMEDVAVMLDSDPKEATK